MSIEDYYPTKDEVYRFTTEELLNIWDLPINPYTIKPITNDYLYKIKDHFEYDTPIPTFEDIMVEITNTDIKEYELYIKKIRKTGILSKASFGILKVIFEINHD